LIDIVKDFKAHHKSEGEYRQYGHFKAKVIQPMMDSFNAIFDQNDFELKG